jgi:DNA-binding winged helix-turn-helix (wHTH) protein
MPERVFYRFGEYRLDAQSRALYRGGELVRLEPKIADMLLFLIERRGLVVSKEELMEQVWQGTIVEDTAVRRNISLMRSTLDPTNMNRFVETLPRQGYRFSATVEVQSDDQAFADKASQSVASIAPGNSRSASADQQGARHMPRRRLLLVSNSILIAIVVAVLVFKFVVLPDWREPEFESRQLTTNAEEFPIVAAAISPDGDKIAFADQTQLYVGDPKTVERHVLPLPDKVIPGFIEWLPDNNHLLVSSIIPDTRESSLWRVSVLGGNAELLLRDVHMAVPSSDGTQIVFVRNDNELWLADSNGANARKLFSSPAGMVFGTRPQFSPDGKRVVYKLVSANTTGSKIESRSIDNGEAVELFQSELAVTDFRLISANELILSQQLGRGSNSSQLVATQVQLQTGVHGMLKTLLRSPDSLQTAFNATRDGRTMVAIASRYYSSVYVADLVEQGTAMVNARRLTMNDSHNLPSSWLAGSDTVLMFSNRTGHYGIYEQSIHSADAHALVSDNHDYIRPVATADHKWLFYFMPEDILKQEPDLRMTLYRQAMGGGNPEVVDIKSDFYRSLRCATAASTCVIADHEKKQLVFREFDPEHGVGREIMRTEWQPTSTSFYWDLSRDGKTIAFIDTASGLTDISIFAIDTPAIRKHVHVDGYDPFATLYWDSLDSGCYVSSYNASGDVLSLLHIDLDGKAKLMLQQLNSQLSWAIPSDDGKTLAFQKFSRKSNIWMLSRRK